MTMDPAPWSSFILGRLVSNSILGRSIAKADYQQALQQKILSATSLGCGDAS